MKPLLSLLICFVIQVVGMETLQAQGGPSAPKKKQTQGSAVSNPPPPRRTDLDSGKSEEGVAKQIHPSSQSSRGAARAVGGSQRGEEGEVATEENLGQQEKAAERLEEGGGEEKIPPPQAGIEEKKVVLKSPALTDKDSLSARPWRVWALAVFILSGVSWIGWSTTRWLRKGLPEEIDDRVHRALSGELGKITQSVQRLERIDPRIEGKFDEIDVSSQQIVDRLGTMGQEINLVPQRISAALQEQLSIALRKEISEALQEQFQMERKRVEEKKIATLVTRIQKELEAQRCQYPIIDVACVVKQVFRSASDPKFVSSAKFDSYLRLADQWEKLQEEVTGLGKYEDVNLEDQQQEMQEEVQVFREQASQLTQDHRPVWFVPFLEKASGDAALNENLRRLKDTLGIEDFCVQQGDEARDLKEFDIARIEGEGTRPVIDEMIERGYRERTTSVVIKKPKVNIRLLKG